MAELTLDDVRARMRVAGIEIAEARLEMVRRLLSDSLKPVRAMDARALRTLEPAVTFDAGAASKPASEADGQPSARTGAPAAREGDAGARPDTRVGAVGRGHTTGTEAVRENVAVTPSDVSAELGYAGIRDLGDRFRAGKLSPVELTRTLLDRIGKVDPTLHAFVTLTAERALADAAAAELALRRGDAGPLAGIPVAYKDLYATCGILTTAGSAVLADWIPDADATCVTRLERAGTVMLGKLITHEFAFGIQFPGHRFLPARNPWNVEHVPGGSSSGSGAALAAGLCTGALGSDTGGSIRGPAAFCGIVGLKPTYGRVSRAGVVTLSWTLDHAGPMARTVEDCAVLLQALAGHDPADPASSRAPVDDYLAPLGASIRGVRVGVPRAYFLDGVHPDVRQGFDDALAALRRLGATVEDVELPSIHTSWAFMAILLSEAFAYHERDIRERPELFGEFLRERILAGALVTGPEYVQAQRLRARLQTEMAAALRTVDVLATPTTPGPAPTFAATFSPDFGFPRSNMAPFNMAGLPTLALPCGFSSNGLPVSLQLAGRPFEEATVLRVGHAYERETDWRTRRPPV
jgi:aspartyl-tRNA(Asn)/glutamyl-tRNA(Gln) amidotransferase subunit A